MREGCSLCSLKAPGLRGSMMGCQRRFGIIANLPGLRVSPPTQCHGALQAMDFKHSDFLCACAVWRLIAGLLNLNSEIVYDE